MAEEYVAGLHWGIKASFVDYVSRMPDGRGLVTAGAQPTEGNIIVFEPSEVSAWPGSGADFFCAFRGEVRFSGHHGMLYVRIANPWVTVHDGKAEMTVLDPQDAGEGLRFPLVRFTLGAVGADTWSSSNVRLTSEGSELFNDVYPSGEPFESLSIHLPRRRQRVGSSVPAP